jgi:inorganic pyrophosphatase
VIETPKESRIKIKLDAETGEYIFDRVLPPGMRFPFNFGFVPNTRAEDGDPTDVIVVLGEVLFPGCVAQCRVLGVIRAEQTEAGETNRNDRIVAVPIKDRGAPKSMADLPGGFVDDVARFFANYHEAEGNQFKVIGSGDADEALQLIRRTTV